MSRVGRMDGSCDYCGLPISGATRSSNRSPIGTASDVTPDVRNRAQFCCFGCRFAASVAAESGEEGQARWTLARLGLSVFFSMIVMVFSLALWSQEIYDIEPSPASRSLLDLFRYACLLATAPVLLLLGGPLLENAWENWRQGRLSTDVLLVVGTVAAFGLSVRSVLMDHGPVYFEVACVVLLAVTLGRWLEATGRLKTTQALRSLEKLLPSQVRVVELAGGDKHGAEHTIPLEQVEVGQYLRVLPGERIPVDGRIRRNQAAIDEQVVTGESQPSVKEVGDRVLAGTLNLDGDLLIEVTASPQDGALQRLIAAVCAAAMARGEIQRSADRVTSWFLPLVAFIALLTFVVHAALHDAETGLLSALAVLLIACPCALGIATPLAIWAAMGRAARSGVLFRNGDALHRFARVQAILFDKTGTLTTGEPEVVELLTDNHTPRRLILTAAGRVAGASAHTLSTAIRQFADSVELSSETNADAGPLVDEARTVPGRGVIATVPAISQSVYLGSHRFMRDVGMSCSSEFQQRIEGVLRAGSPVACVGWNGEVRGVFVFREQLRDAAQPTLNELRESGCQVAVLTGDHDARGQMLAETLGVQVESEQLPDEKAAAIRRWRKVHGSVAMVGDGINDAPALAAADVGVAMGCGADVSRDTADVCLLGNDLRRILWAMQLARRTMRTVNQNLFWAFAYNVVGIAIAAVGWLNPIFAAAAMVVSSLFVITNSLRLSSDHTALSCSNYR